jgi:hypothetical protein
LKKFERSQVEWSSEANLNGRCFENSSTVKEAQKKMTFKLFVSTKTEAILI